MAKTLTASIETLQEMIEALETLKLIYTVKVMHLPIKAVKELFAEQNIEYDGAAIGLNDALNGLFTGYVLNDTTIISVWMISIHRN